MGQLEDEWNRDAARKERRWAIAGTVAKVAVLLIVIVGGYFVSMNLIAVGDDRAQRAIEAQGFRDVKLGDTDALACAENESSRHFRARNPLGNLVEGTVCCGVTGVGKGCTLRWGR